MNKKTAPNSILGKVGLGIAGMISFFSKATGMIVGIVIVIAVLAEAGGTVLSKADAFPE